MIDLRWRDAETEPPEPGVLVEVETEEVFAYGQRLAGLGLRDTDDWWDWCEEPIIARRWRPIINADDLAWHDPKEELPELNTRVEAIVRQNPEKRVHLFYCIGRTQPWAKTRRMWRTDDGGEYSGVILWREVIP